MTENAKTVAITGASGLIGSSLSRWLREQGHTPIAMVRNKEADGIYWSVEKNEIDASSLVGVDVVVHLAGENLADGRWTEAQKKRILESRVKGTTLVASALGALSGGPGALISASGVNYYGADRGDEALDESRSPGEGFLAEVCKQWEAACAPAVEAGLRVVNARFGVALSKKGGALKKMLLPFKMGLGGKLGSGEQYFSWVALEDLVRAVGFLIENQEIKGPVNVAAPNPVTNAEFTKALGQVLGRPTVFSVPAPALKLALGSDMAEEALLQGPRVIPARLQEAGFEFHYPTIEEALKAELK